MAYSSKIKRYKKIDDGTYYIQKYSTGTYWFKVLIELLGTIIFFPFIVIKNIFFGKKKEESNA